MINSLLSLNALHDSREQLHRELPDLGGFGGGRQSCNDAEWAEYEWACRIHQGSAPKRTRKPLAGWLRRGRRNAGPSPLQLPPENVSRKA